LLSGCQGRHYFSAEEPPPGALRYSLETLPYKEYWTGLSFNGKKIGFSRVALRREGENHVIESETALQMRLLDRNKGFRMFALDRIAPDLRLQEFEYRYSLDGSRLELRGRVEDERLQIQIVNAAGVHEQDLDLGQEPVYPRSALLLYPLVQGIRPGVNYRYRVYDAEDRQLSEVRQYVTGYERSNLFAGGAYRLQTWIRAQEAIAWIGAKGQPLLESSLDGVMTALLQREAQARDYLVQAALNREETLINYSLVPADRRIADPLKASALTLALSGMGEFPLPVPNSRQQCAPADNGDVICRTLATVAHSEPAPPDEQQLQRYLEHTPILPTGHPTLEMLATDIAAGLEDPGERMRAVFSWIRDNIGDDAVDVFTALDVLKQRNAECQGQSFLYTSLARTLGIPTRVVNGLVYSKRRNGFLYHTWAESWDGNAWRSIDPTLGQFPVDVTHIRLIDGAEISDLTPLLQLIGQIQARVLEVGAP